MENKTVKKAKKTIFHVIFSRAFVLIVLLLVQLALFIVPMRYLQDYGKYYNAFFYLVSLVATIYIINEHSNPAFQISWILFIAAAPVFGTAFFLYMKLQPGTFFLKKRLEQLTLEIREYMQQEIGTVEHLRLSKPANANLAHYLSEQVGYPIYKNTEVIYFPLGEDKFEALKNQLHQAEHYIFMEYFIVEEGLMWNEVLQILKEKVAMGVEVRFMYDGMNSIQRFPYNYPKTLRSYGIKCKVFNQVKPVLSTYQNNRDHRKICVIDGKVAFTGGVNLSDEYINARERFGHWKDTAIMLKGEAVQSFTMMFLNLWNIDEKLKENYDKYLTPKSSIVRRELGFVLPYGDSPYDRENVGEQVYFHILNHAKKYVHIMTPYLILDSEMITTLTHTAKCGIEVIIIMPHIPDKKYAFWLAHTYYEELIQAGVQIYEYTPGFVHAKVFVSDNDTAVVGTINLDYRSFYHHFECGAFVYNNPSVWEVERDFQNTLKKCQKITVMDLKKGNLFTRIIGRVLRLIAPLM